MTSKLTDSRPAKRPSLGKGITSLLGGFEVEGPSQSEATGKTQSLTKPGGSSRQDEADQGNHVIYISQNAIELNPHQPRRIFRDSELSSLASSIKVDGILQPITVMKLDKPDRYMLVAGERRLRASKLAGLDKIPAIVRDPMGEQEQLRLALIENIQRQDLNVIEEAEAYQSLIDNFGLTQETCAEKVGKERSTVANTLRILQLPKEVRDDLIEQRLTMGHGRALLSIEDRKLILRARDIVIKKGLNVRQTEQLVKNYKAKPVGATSKSSGDRADLDYLADNLRSTLMTKVNITGTGARGKIEISYFSSSELERLLTIFGK